MKKDRSGEEILDIFDEDENVIGSMPRSLAKKERKLILGAGVLVLNSKKKLLIHRRALDKPTNPGKWDFKFGGHQMSGESPEETARRELFEEAGINGTELELVIRFIYNHDSGRDIMYIYRTIYDGEIVMQEDEVSEIEWVDPNEIEELMEERVFAKNNYRFFDMHKKEILEAMGR